MFTLPPMQYLITVTSRDEWDAVAEDIVVSVPPCGREWTCHFWEPCLIANIYFPSSLTSHSALWAESLSSITSLFLNIGKFKKEKNKAHWGTQLLSGKAEIWTKRSLASKNMFFPVLINPHFPQGTESRGIQVRIIWNKNRRSCISSPGCKGWLR